MEERETQTILNGLLRFSLLHLLVSSFLYNLFGLLMLIFIQPPTNPIAKNHLASLFFDFINSVNAHSPLP